MATPFSYFKFQSLLFLALAVGLNLAAVERATQQYVELAQGSVMEASMYGSEVSPADRNSWVADHVQIAESFARPARDLMERWPAYLERMNDLGRSIGAPRETSGEKKRAWNKATLRATSGYCGLLDSPNPMLMRSMRT